MVRGSLNSLKLSFFSKYSQNQYFYFLEPYLSITVLRLIFKTVINECSFTVNFQKHNVCHFF